MALKHPEIRASVSEATVLRVGVSGPMIRTRRGEVHQNFTIDGREIDYAYKYGGATAVLQLFASRCSEANEDIDSLYQKARNR